MYRVTRTIIRGQHANDQCFTVWLAASAPHGVQFVKVFDEPLNNGGPNDTRLYLWNQQLPVKTPTCPNSDPFLVTNNGKNGWDTQAGAQAVIDYELGQGKVIADNVKAANAAAVDPLKIAGDAAKELGADVKDAVSTSGPWLAIGLLGLGALGLAWVFRR